MCVCVCRCVNSWYKGFEMLENQSKERPKLTLNVIA